MSYSGFQVDCELIKYLSCRFWFTEVVIISLMPVLLLGLIQAWTKLGAPPLQGGETRHESKNMSCSLTAVKSLYQRTCHISSGWHGIHTRGRTCLSCSNADGKTMPQLPPSLSCSALHLFPAQSSAKGLCIVDELYPQSEPRPYLQDFLGETHRSSLVPYFIEMRG